MIITGTHTCEHCNSDIKWEYQEVEIIRHGMILDVDRIDKTKVRPQLLDKNENNKYLFRVRCKNCYGLNEFVYPESNET